LGYTAALADNDLISIYQNHLDTFLHYHDIKQHPTTTIATLSFAIAEMINWTAYLFRLFHYL
jgi:hypothetical protein